MLSVKIFNLIVGHTIEFQAPMVPLGGSIWRQDRGSELPVRTTAPISSHVPRPLDKVGIPVINQNLKIPYLK